MSLTYFKNSPLTILGYSNAKIGKEDIHKPTTGHKILHNETNNKRIKIIQFAISEVFKVRSTTFPHKDITKRHGIKQTVGQRIK